MKPHDPSSPPSPSSPSLEARLERIRHRLALLERCDEERQVFGAMNHDYALEPPLDEAELADFERAHGITLPADYRAFLATLGRAGAGPFYGLRPLAAPSRETTPFMVPVDYQGEDDEVGTLRGPEPRLERPFPLSAAWRPADGDEAPPVPPGTSLYDGTLQLTDHGCGYFDVLVVHGPCRGQVWADFSQALEGLAPWYPSFLDAYEAWLDRAFVDWVCQAAPSLARRPLDEDLEAALALAGPLLERFVDDAEAPQDPARVAYPTGLDALLSALAMVRVVQGRHEDALELVERATAHASSEPEARRHLGRARIFGARGELTACLAEAEAGLDGDNLWFSTRTELLREKHAALSGLERDDEALQVLRELAEVNAWDLHTLYDLAWVLIERGELDEPVALLAGAAERGVGCDPNAPLAERLEQVPLGLFDALEREGLGEVVATLRGRLQLAAAPRTLH